MGTKGATVRHEKVVESLNQPLAQGLLGSTVPARLAYNGLDGFRGWCQSTCLGAAGAILSVSPTPARSRR